MEGRGVKGNETKGVRDGECERRLVKGKEGEMKGGREERKEWEKEREG